MFRKIVKGPEQNRSIWIPYNSCLMENHQRVISVIPRKMLIVGFHFSKFGCCTKSTPSQYVVVVVVVFVFLSLANFFRKGIKNN